MNISKILYPKKTYEKTVKNIKKLGLNSNLSVDSFLIKRTTLVFITFLTVLFIFEKGYILAPLLSLGVYMLYDYILLLRHLQKRKDSLEKDAMYFFEIMTLSLETGHGIKKALDLTSENVSSLLSDEVKILLKEVRLGKNLNEAIDSLKERVPSEDVHNIFLNIQEANLFGSGIIETMYNQIDYMREKEIQYAKARITKVPVQVSIISVLIYIPLIMLLILGPVFLKMIGD